MLSFSSHFHYTNLPSCCLCQHIVTSILITCSHRLANSSSHFRCIHPQHLDSVALYLLLLSTCLDYICQSAVLPFSKPHSSPYHCAYLEKSLMTATSIIFDEHKLLTIYFRHTKKKLITNNMLDWKLHHFMIWDVGSNFELPNICWLCLSC